MEEHTIVFDVEKEEKILNRIHIHNIRVKKLMEMHDLNEKEAERIASMMDGGRLELLIEDLPPTDEELDRIKVFYDLEGDRFNELE